MTQQVQLCFYCVFMFLFVSCGKWVTVCRNVISFIYSNQINYFCVIKIWLSKRDVCYLKIIKNENWCYLTNMSKKIPMLSCSLMVHVQVCHALNADTIPHAGLPIFHWEKSWWSFLFLSCRTRQKSLTYSVRCVSVCTWLKCGWFCSLWNMVNIWFGLYFWVENPD